MPEHEVMKGFPPTVENRVNLDNWRQPPFNAWALHHVREIMPTAAVHNNPDDVRELGSGDTVCPKLPIQPMAMRLYFTCWI